MSCRFVVSTLVLGLFAGNAVAQKVVDVPSPSEAKGYETVPSPYAPEATGGPDAFGYRYIDSAEPGGPVFNFVDISGTGTALGLSDDGEANVTLSFPFPFYGVNQTQVRVGNNGGLLLGTATGDVGFTNFCPLPSTAGSTAPRISVFWDDFDDETGNVYHQTFASCPVSSGGTGQCWIVQWHNRPHFDGIGAATVQAVLYASGSILFQYPDTDFGDTTYNAGASASIGIEDEAANPGYALTYSCNQVGAVPNSRAVLFRRFPAAAGATIQSESCAAANGAIDPGETVTVSLCLSGTVATTNLVGTLLATGGVENPSAPQSYGVVGGTPVCRSFTFNADLGLTCGANLTATLALQDGATAYPNTSFTFTTGTLVSTGPPTAFANAGAITINASGNATPYPSGIAVAALTGTVSKVTVTLTGVSHTFPDDVDVLLVGPSGAALVLMSDAGLGFDLTGINLTFDDAAAGLLPDSTLIAAGTYRPTNYGAPDAFGAPAPAVVQNPATAGAATLASVFNGTAPNGTWNLFVVDDAGGDSGSISGGWSLSISTVVPSCCTGACTVTAPANVTVPNAANFCGAPVVYPPPTISGICGQVACTPLSGSFFPVGTTTVTCDPEAAGSNATSSVTVNDVQAPTIGACPADIVVAAPPGALSVAVDFAPPTASDNCPGVTLACVPAPGDAFPVGTTTDVCTAADAAGGSASCSFDVTVGNLSVQEIPTASTLGLAALALLLAGAAFVALRRGA